MAPKQRVVSSSSSTSPPSRPPESDLEILYNTAVQSFVRRDHGKTQAALSRLLKHTESLEYSTRWYDLEKVNGKGEEEGNEWKIKILKLVISADASLYSDPPTNSGTIPPELAKLLHPSSPDLMLEHVKSICNATLSDIDLLPPAIISTLLLASLKLKPAPKALDFAHNLAETWLAGLPDSFIHSISTTTKVQGQSPQTKKRVEGSREGYLKVIELFVGEVLAREGDFEMARALLDGEGVMSSKRKEDLYRHLRSTETRLANTTSPSSSGILPPQSPSASLLLPSATANGSGRSSRSRSSTTSSSSSERTARPNVNGLNQVGASGYLDVPNGKGKGKDSEAVSVDSNSTFHFPDKIYINPSNPKSSTPPSRRPLARVPRNLADLFEMIPASIRKRLSYPILALLPIPLITIVLLIWYVRRRARQLRSLVGGATRAVAAVQAGESVQERLKRARALGMRAWFGHWLGWWWKKLLGVWEMGTTITYV